MHHQKPDYIEPSYMHLPKYLYKHIYILSNILFLKPILLLSTQYKYWARKPKYKPAPDQLDRLTDLKFDFNYYSIYDPIKSKFWMVELN